MKTQQFSLQTVNHIETFAKPAVETGLIPKEEYRAAFRALRREMQDGRKSTDQAEEPEAMLSASKVARLLDCSTRTVFRLADSGKLERVYLKPGVNKSIRFRKSDVFRLMREGGAI